MEEKNHFDNLKLNELRADIQAGIASGDAGTLDADEIKRRGHARHAAILRDMERRYKLGQEVPVDWDVAKQELRERHK
jgi:putative NADH-flavin reductase